MNELASPAHDRALSDRIELRARRDLFAAAPQDFACALLDVPATGATLMRVPALPVPGMNRVVGLDGAAPLADATLAWIRQAYRDGGLGAFWLHAWDAPDDAPLQASYAAHGLTRDPQAAWIKLLFDFDGPVPQMRPHPVLHVRRAAPDEAHVSGAIVCQSFGMPAAMAAWMGAVVGRPGWQVYLAIADGVPVATAALFIDGPHAWLGMGATLPQARGEGCQQMLLAVRMAAAKAAGCVVAGIETEAPAPDTALHSLNNVRRAGFRAVGRRLNFLCRSDPAEG